MRLLLVTLTLTAGCTSAPTEKPTGAPPATMPQSQAASAITFELGRSVSGRPIEALLLGGDRQKPLVLMLATIHGDEPTGTPLLRGLELHLAAHPELLEERAVLLVPIANPDGLEQASRQNSRKIDLNRNYPASNFRAGRFHGPAPLSEPETQALFGLIHNFKPIRVVTIHMHAACLDYDGPAADLARAMSESCGLPVRRLGAQPGSLGSYLGQDLGTPIITLELSRQDRNRPERQLFEKYGPALLEAIRWE